MCDFACKIRLHRYVLRISAYLLLGWRSKRFGLQHDLLWSRSGFISAYRAAKPSAMHIVFALVNLAMDVRYHDSVDRVNCVITS